MAYKRTCTVVFFQNVPSKCILQGVRHCLWKIFPDEGIVAGCDKRIRDKYTTK